MDDDAVALLSVCDDQLSRARPEAVIAMEDLAALQQKTQELAKEVSQSAIDSFLRNYVLGFLELIEHALSDYQVVGIRSIRRASEIAIGRAVSTRKDFQRVQDLSFGKRFGDLLGWIVLVSGAYAGLKEIASDLGLLLPPAEAEEQRIAEVETLVLTVDEQNVVTQQ